MADDELTQEEAVDVLVSDLLEETKAHLESLGDPKSLKLAGKIELVLDNFDLNGDEDVGDEGDEDEEESDFDVDDMDDKDEGAPEPPEFDEEDDGD